MAEPLSLPVLARLWQLLLKGVGELGQAPSPRLALEMVLIRTAYAADLPSPADLVKQLQEAGQKASVGMPSLSSGQAAAKSATSQPKPVGAMPVPAADFRPPPVPPRAKPQSAKPQSASQARTPKSVQTGALSAERAAEPERIGADQDEKPDRALQNGQASYGQTSHGQAFCQASQVAPMLHEEPRQDWLADDEGPPPDYDVPPPAEVEMERIPVPTGFREFVRMLEQRKIEPLLTARLRTLVRPISFETGAVSLALEPGADPELVSALRSLLNRLFGGEWSVMRAPSAHTQTVAEAAAEEEAAEHEAVLAHPLVQAALDTFPGAQVAQVRHRPIADPGDWTATIPPAPDEMIAGDEFDDEDDDQ